MNENQILKIEPGKLYGMRNGWKLDCLAIRENWVYGLYQSPGSGWSAIKHRLNGSFVVAEVKHDFDIVSEWKEEAEIASNWPESWRFAHRQGMISSE